FFFFHCSGAPRALHSFPTRRSSDLLSFIDRVHAAGRRVLLDGGDSTPGGREYSLASYFLVATGEDGVGPGSMSPEDWWPAYDIEDRKSTRLNSSHVAISYAVFCLKK